MDPRRLLTVLDRAVTVDGWPATATVHALLAVAADPATASPMRLAASGPWCDLPHRPAVIVLTSDEQAELDQLTAQLDRLPDSGVGARYTARTQRTAAHQPRTRLTIARRAVHLLDQRQKTASGSALGSKPQASADVRASPPAVLAVSSRSSR